MPDTSKLEALLDREKAAILAGTFDKVFRLSPEKQSLLDAVSRTESCGARLRGIAASVSRNQTLLASAMDGLRSVNDRLADLRRARDGFETYGPEGAKSRVGAAQPAFQRTA